MNRKRYLAHVGIAGLVGMGGVVGAAHAGPSLVFGSRRFRRYDEPENKEPTAEELKATIASLTNERDKYKGDFERVDTEHKTTAQKLKEREDKEKTDSQRLADDKKASDDRANAAEARAKETSVRLQIERAARRLNLADEDAAYRLLDLGAIKYDAEGKPTNVDALLDQLAKDKPFLVAQSGGAGGNGGGGGNPHNPGRDRSGALTMEQIEKMSTAEINANWDKVQAALAAGK